MTTQDQNNKMEIETTEIDIDKAAEDYLNQEIAFQVQKKKFYTMYYQDFFPFYQVYDWLSYCSKKSNGKPLDPSNDYFHRREISYMIKADNDIDEFCMRHLCYSDMEEFKKDVLNNKPIRIDIGPVCDKPPSINKDGAQIQKAVAVEREFVIDIDLSDYDAIRSCCSGKKMCERCWRFMVSAYKVLRPALMEDFGFKHILWVFSGRRGIHAWVCDERARLMENYSRKSLTAYLDISVGNDKAGTLVKPQVKYNKEYTLFTRSYNLLLPDFEDIVIKDQQYLANDKNAELIWKIFSKNIALNNQNKKKGYQSPEEVLGG